MAGKVSMETQVNTTMATGAPKVCGCCKKIPEITVIGCGNGYYIGTLCDCGPYSRESDYYGDAGEAKARLRFGNYSRTY